MVLVLEAASAIWQSVLESKVKEEVKALFFFFLLFFSLACLCG